MLTYEPETFTSTKGIGILCLLPYLQAYGITQVIENSEYPETERLNCRCSLLSFVALKLSNIRRYSSDNNWCIDRGLRIGWVGIEILHLSPCLPCSESPFVKRLRREARTTFT